MRGERGRVLAGKKVGGYGRAPGTGSYTVSYCFFSKKTLVLKNVGP